VILEGVLTDKGRLGKTRRPGDKETGRKGDKEKKSRETTRAPARGDA